MLLSQNTKPHTDIHICSYICESMRHSHYGVHALETITLQYTVNIPAESIDITGLYIS